MEKQLCECGKKSVVYLPTGNYCARCFTDKVQHAKRDTYKHLVSIGLGRQQDETKEDWIKRMKNEFMSRSRKLEKKCVY